MLDHGRLICRLGIPLSAEAAPWCPHLLPHLPYRPVGTQYHAQRGTMLGGGDQDEGAKDKLERARNDPSGICRSCTNWSKSYAI